MTTVKSIEPTPSIVVKGFTIPVHDHGFVRYIEHMGTDTDIVEAARVSYRGGSKGEEADKKLLHYLFRNKHTSPFEMVKVKFNIKMPIFVMRQFIRHRMQNVNEVSARYSELPDDFFIPTDWRLQDKKNKQSSVLHCGRVELLKEMPRTDVDGSVYMTNDPTLVLMEFYDKAYATYKAFLAAGIAREQARMVLPVGIYTQFYCCWDLNNLLKYFALRDDPHAQAEHQDYARAMKQIVRELFPWTMEVYDESIGAGPGQPPGASAT